MRWFAIVGILGLVDSKSLAIKGSNGKKVERLVPIDYTEEHRSRVLGVGPRPVAEDVLKGAGKSKGKEDSANQVNVDDEREGNTGGGGVGDPIVLDPTPSPTIRPTIPASTGLSTPTTLPTDTPSTLPSASTILPTISMVTPTGLPSDAPSALPSAPAILAETIAPTNTSPSSSPSSVGTNSGTITRNLLPFDITVQGEESELQMVQIPLELSVNEFLSEKMEGSFQSFKDIALQTIELSTIQRQSSRKSFGFTGDAKFYDINVPTTEEVQDVQQRALSDFSFELQNILHERNVTINVVDLSVDDEDGDSNQQDNNNKNNDDGGTSEDVSSVRGGIEPQNGDEPSDSSSVAIGLGTTAAVLVLVCAILLYLQQQKAKIEDNKELEFLDDPDLMDDPDLDGAAYVDHMIDTSAGQPQSIATAEYV